MNRFQYARVLFVTIVGPLLAGGLYFSFWRERPYVLMRFSAARTIEATAEFQHKTKLFFVIGQAEGAIPPSCHNFEFAPDKIAIFKHYRATGAMQFSPYGNQLPPFPPVTEGSLTLSTINERFLVDDIDECQARKVKETTGAYELALGKAVVAEVTGIRKEGNRAVVDFKWRFESLNEVGPALPEIQLTKSVEVSDVTRAGAQVTSGSMTRRFRRCYGSASAP